MPATILSDNGASSGTAGLKTSGSNDGTLVLQTTTAGGTATTAITIDTSQAATFAQTANLPNTFGFKNRIINGEMDIDQRNAGASITPTSAQYSVDRWQCFLTQASKYTIQQNAGSVTPPAGFTNYLGVTSTSAYSIVSSDFFMFRQAIEGLNVADLGWGTANAKTVTVSFWVRSSLTGTFGGTLMNSAADRSYPFTYTISAANTWEYETITIAGDTSGTWLSNTNTGVYLQFGLGVGSTLSGTAGAWTGTSNIFSATGATSVVGTNGATFYITGVQLEVGSTATSFDYRDYGRELILCQRYFQNLHASSLGGKYISSFVASSTTEGFGVNFLPVSMRAEPALAITLSGGTTKYRFNGGTTDQNSDTNPTIGNTTNISFRLNFSGFTGLTAGNTGWVTNRDSTAGYFGVTAEL
jgi:hypothetical protein